jgi:hypothetical protein
MKTVAEKKLFADSMAQPILYSPTVAEQKVSKSTAV